jgi:hypothetical protein
MGGVAWLHSRILACGYDVDEVPVEFNFSMHLGGRIANFAFANPEVSLLLQDPRRKYLAEKSWHQTVDYAVTRIN